MCVIQGVYHMYDTGCVSCVRYRVCIMCVIQGVCNWFDTGCVSCV